MDSINRTRHEEKIIYELYESDIKEAVLLLLKHKHGLDLSGRPGKLVLPADTKLPIVLIYKDETFEEMGYIDTAASPGLRGKDGD